MRYGVHLCYNGSAFAGWQRQMNAVSIQEEIEKALSVLLKSEIAVTGCGRTDTGVHAYNFFAHFDTDTPIQQPDSLVYHLNAILPAGILVYHIFPAADSWNARFDATKRTYRYFMMPQRSPFLSPFAMLVPYAIDVEKMRKAASALAGTHDFTSFAKLHGGQNNGICHVYRADIFERDGLIIFEISADRFIRNMVRAITGTLLEIGRGRLSADNISEIMQACDRSQAGASVPAHGLFLYEIHYENHPEIPENRKSFF